MNKKEFALSQIAPYYKNPALCGYEDNRCTYITEDGKMCVFGKNMINPNKGGDFNADDLLYNCGEEIIKPEVRGILTPKEWRWLQLVHDGISETDNYAWDARYNESIDPLFTQKELEDYAARID